MRSQAPHAGESPVDTLRRFDYQVQQLCDRRLLQPGNLRPELHLGRLPGGQFEPSFHNPDEEDLRSLVMDLRHFLMENSPVFMNRVFSIAHQHVTEEPLVEALKRERKQWNRVLREGEGRFLQEGGPTFTTTEILQAWLYGRYFHLDDDHAQSVRKLDEAPMTRWMLITAVTSAVNGVIRTGMLVRIALREGYVSAAPVR